jgi:hypothetical protein
MLGECDLEELLNVIGRLSFRVAKSMPQIPHQYTVRAAAADEADYIALHNAIRENGVIERWHGRRVLGSKPIERGPGRPMRYLYPGDGWRYWYMSAIWRSKIINRNRVEDAARLREEGLIS